MVIAYLRVSTDEQAQSGLGLEAQLAEIETTIDKPDAIYTDEGYSGANRKRPALHEAIARLKKGDTFCVAKLDRLSRNLLFQLELEAEIVRRGARFLSAAGEGTEVEGADGEMMRQLHGMFAQRMRARIAENTRAAMAQKKKRGEYTGGNVPFGFNLAQDGSTLVPNDAERAVIKSVRVLRAEGLSLRQIATNLEKRGILTKQGRSKWNPKTVRTLAA